MLGGSSAMKLVSFEHLCLRRMPGIKKDIDRNLVVLGKACDEPVVEPDR